MLSIRLTRTGKVHDPHYRIVVQEKRSKLNGKAVDQIGHYHPATPGKQIVIDAEKAKAWMAKGAQPSDTVTNLFVKHGILDASRKITHFYTPAVKEVVAEAPKAAAPAPKVEEVVAEEVVVEETPATEEPTAVEEVVAEEPAVEEAPAEEAPGEEVAAE